MDHPTKEEEAHFYFTLREFEELIDRHGAEYVLGCMSLQQYRKIQSAFLDDDY